MISTSVRIRLISHFSRNIVQNMPTALRKDVSCVVVDSSIVNDVSKAYRNRWKSNDMNVNWGSFRGHCVSRIFETHSILISAILGLIPRKCPKEPLAELFWELKTCNTDHDCWPRICCPDGGKKYCRTSRPELDTLPAGRQFAYRKTHSFIRRHSSWFNLQYLLKWIAIDALSGYLQCTPPPPTDYDLHPKVCNNTLDCFPNVCCQEAGKKHCRPPKRSLLAFITTFAQVNCELTINSVASVIAQMKYLFVSAFQHGIHQTMDR